MNNHRSASFEIPSKDDELDLPSLYWMPKVRKMKLQSYCDTGYSRYGANQMWILKNSIDLLDYIVSRFLSSGNSSKILTCSPSTQLFLTLS
jgi:hypothetical protein